MRIAVIGSGPGGLHVATLLKRARPDFDVKVYEQNPEGATFGFGVVFSQGALDFLKKDDPETHDLITQAMESWEALTINHRNVSIPIDGVNFFAIERLNLQRILAKRATETGVEIFYEHPIKDVAELSEADVIIGADGVNSLVRNSDEAGFGATVKYLSNKFIWYGTTKPFDTLTQTFRETEKGPITVHHYRYAPKLSTFLIELDRPTWDNFGFADLNEDETKALCEKLFAPELDGHPLLSNNSHWREFPNIHNAHWSSGNKVLLGDALHTAHFSIGSGTRLAMEDAIALSRALLENPDAPLDALKKYEAERRPILEKLVTAALTSADWYEHMGEHMRLAPYDFAYSYIIRSGRIADDKLQAMSPKFMASYQENKNNVAV